MGVGSRRCSLRLSFQLVSVLSLSSKIPLKMKLELKRSFWAGLSGQLFLLGPNKVQRQKMEARLSSPLKPEGSFLEMKVPPPKGLGSNL